MTDKEDRASGPSQAPPVSPHVSLSLRQWIGLPLIAAVPILTILGVFGERATQVSARSIALDVHVTYPVRFRYRQVQSLRVSVRNVSPDTLDSVSVSFDTAYIQRFSSVRFDPAIFSAYVARISKLAPGSTGSVFVELWGEQYGRHLGRVTITTRGDSVDIPLSTFVFP